MKGKKGQKNSQLDLMNQVKQNKAEKIVFQSFKSDSRFGESIDSEEVKTTPRKT